MMRTFFAAALLAVPFAADAQPITNIAGEPAAYEEFYSEVRGWYVASSGSPSAYCAAYRVNDPSIRIGYASGQWQIGIQGPARPNWTGSLTIDGNRRGTSGNAKYGWTFVWLNIGELNGLMKGTRAVVDIERSSVDMSLAGVTAATLKVAECVQVATGRLPPLP